ncbi:MalY/PatB family protein [Modestobacter sp. VKM Ac-2978]|uniref:MalY/PatB family protein n=1 Tax=Modestobacter sp. VKM Ac-2978 TaxID=3004132 RepID=UPI0022AA5334|nr:aminotransferase class I/II-fold pyridoxal phosphate-dependent enzyme [Modestobacter sp. VKM Ac-2978]MCZ2849927.1 aminotransferase class I/II-fold pyridoxal phosphate-dependent enzyme [Modestobacter sp. VKM Ac-2978]
MTEIAGLDPARLRGGHGAKWTAVPEDVIPAWVADMDIGIPGPVRERLTETIERGDLGYPYWAAGDPVVDAFEEHMLTRFGWPPAPGRSRVMSDLIQILQVTIEHTTEPGDAIALHVPAYPPFLASIARAGRTIVPLPVHRSTDGWHLDLEEHRRLVAHHRPRLLVLVNPHNPTGRAFRQDELLGIADIALTHRIPVFADEIHADLTYAPHTHTPFASLSHEIADLTITTTSPGKAFNLAGMRCAIAHVGHTPMAEALAKAPLDYFGTPSVLSRIAAVAAWRESAEWFEIVMDGLTANRALVENWVRRRGDIDLVPPEATYLAWIDFARSAVAADPAGNFMQRARVQLSPGTDFSQYTPVDTTTFARLNFATQSTTLQQVLHRLDAVLDGEH